MSIIRPTSNLKEKDKLLLYSLLAISWTAHKHTHPSKAPECHSLRKHVKWEVGVLVEKEGIITVAIVLVKIFILRGQ